jgi:hypothetical protein
MKTALKWLGGAFAAASILFVAAVGAAVVYPDSDNPAAQIGSVVLKFVNASGQGQAVSASNPLPALALGQTQYNGSGSTTHSAVTTAYATGQLFAANTAGDAAASPIVITGTNTGTGLISHFVVESSGTNQPPAEQIWLYSSPPLTTALVDRSAYIGPYAADLTSAIFIGSFTCSTWNKTNDATAQYWAECTPSNPGIGLLPFKAQAGKTTILALEEVEGAYTPLASEVHTYLASTVRDN